MAYLTDQNDRMSVCMSIRKCAKLHTKRKKKKKRTLEEERREREKGKETKT